MRPVLLYDGECRFCCRWIERWKVATGDRVDYLTAQSSKEKFPDIPETAYGEAVQWIGEDGSHCAGAEAVFWALATSTMRGRALLWAYQSIALFRWITDAVYRLVAKQRMFFSLLTRWLWGSDIRPPSFAFSYWLFLRLLGVCYLIAFLSYWHQAEGLSGNHGIIPATEFFDYAKQALGDRAFSQLPSVCWWGADSASLVIWSAIGIMASVLLIAGVLPTACLIVSWAVYLSLCVAGEIFYGYQWDALILEAGFLAIFFAPLTVRPALWGGASSRVGRFILMWLLFRLMFSSGMVKLASGDPTWANATALDFHYFTQPIPTPLAWFMQQLPAWFQTLSVRGMFFVELVLPFFLFAPGRLRLIAAGGLMALQVLIALTGNYGFFNLLSLALCLLAIDDAAWRRLRIPISPRAMRNMPRFVLYPVAVALIALSMVPFLGTLGWRTPEWLVECYAKVAPFRSINSYGLFAVMTTQRKEIIVQGSDDGVTWKTYSFRYKPGDPHRAPPWVAPYMPRLDWQMWFAALGDIRSNPWFVRFLQRLQQNSPAVVALIETNPFPDKPPKYLRAQLDDYRFTTTAEKKETGDWWKVEPAGVYCPEVSLGGE